MLGIETFFRLIAPCILMLTAACALPMRSQQPGSGEKQLRTKSFEFETVTSATNLSIHLTPHDGGSHVTIHTNTPIGDMALWLPEGIATNSGFSSIYPVGRWEGITKALKQHISSAEAFGPGNYSIDKGTIDFVGIQIPRDQPVEWATSIHVDAGRVPFEIRLRNLGDKPIVGAGAAICLKFLDGKWWSPQRLQVRSAGRDTTLEKLGEDAGKAAGFEAYLLQNQTYDNLFYREFWGFNSHRLDNPVMTSIHPDGWRVSISADQAIFLHSNRGNPCTDVMLSFGNLEPHKEATCQGEIRIEHSP